MMNEAKMTEFTQTEEMAYFRADFCLYSPESYSLEERKQICSGDIPREKPVVAFRSRALIDLLSSVGGLCWIAVTSMLNRTRSAEHGRRRRK